MDYHNKPFQLDQMVDLSFAFWQQFHKKQDQITMKKADWQRILTCFRDASDDDGTKILMEVCPYIENRGLVNFNDNRKIAFELHNFDDNYLYGCLISFVDVDNSGSGMMRVLMKHNTRVKIQLDKPHMPWLVELENAGQMRLHVMARPFMGYEMIH